MVTLHGRTDGSSVVDEGSSSDSGVGQLDGQMREFIPSKSTHSITYQIPEIFGMIKEAILGICDERLCPFCTEIAVMIRTCTLMFREFRAYESSDCHRG